MSNILVATTHLKAKRGFEDLRRAQAEELMAAVELLRGQVGEDSAVVVSGDFNDEPGSLCYNALNTHTIGLRSAYTEYPGGEGVEVRVFFLTSWRLDGLSLA